MRDRVLVLGATGLQGGGVARHLLRRGRFAVRALTRHPDSAKAGELKRQGAEVVQGDLADPASLQRAMKGCAAVFGVTNFWEHFQAERSQGMALMDAVTAAGVGHLVFSSLPSARFVSGGEYSVPHFDIKAEIADYARSLALPVTFVHYAFYYENFLNLGLFQKQTDGSLSFGMPQGDTPLAAVSTEDAGDVVAAIFEQKDKYLGRTVGLVGDDRPCGDYASVLSRAMGVPVHYSHIPREVYAGFGFPGAEELADMFDFNRVFILGRKQDLVDSKALNPAMRTLDEWAAANAGALKAAAGVV